MLVKLFQKKPKYQFYFDRKIQKRTILFLLLVLVFSSLPIQRIGHYLRNVHDEILKFPLFSVLPIQEEVES